jgi:phosphoribosyl 1,2-cyclic phosphate phosphodiesterase
MPPQENITMSMRVTFLGTGTSTGVPMIGCSCDVCRSTDPRNRRRRSSLYLEVNGQGLVVDTPPDFREQVLAYGVRRVDALFFTHAHADHIFGLDDIRRFNTIQDSVIPAYAGSETMADLQRVFNYISAEPGNGVYRPQIDFRTLAGCTEVAGIQVEPLPVVHGNTETFGFLFSQGEHALAYIPDCSELPAEVVARIRGIDVVILDALRDRPHRTHLTVEQSLATLEQVGARESYLVHMSHDLDHSALAERLPAGIKPSYDGLVLDLF